MFLLKRKNDTLIYISPFNGMKKQNQTDAVYCNVGYFC